MFLAEEPTMSKRESCEEKKTHRQGELSIEVCALYISSISVVIARE